MRSVTDQRGQAIQKRPLAAAPGDGDWPSWELGIDKTIAGVWDLTASPTAHLPAASRRPICSSDLPNDWVKSAATTPAVTLSSEFNANDGAKNQSCPQLRH